MGWVAVWGGAPETTRPGQGCPILARAGPGGWGKGSLRPRSGRGYVHAGARHQPPRQRSIATDDGQADLSTYISKMASEAPPLTSEQRDRLALILRGQLRTYDR